MSTTIITAPGKLVLLGEYAVLREGTALVTAVDRCARVSITTNGRTHQRDHFTLTAPELRLAGVPIQIERGGDLLVRCSPEIAARLRPVLAVIAAVNDESPILAQAPADIAIDTSAFFLGGQKLGLGSSAAVCVALTRGLAQHFGLPERDRFDATLSAHRRAQAGVGSGVDVAASWFGGTLAYTMGTAPTRMALPRGVHWVALWTGRSASTPDLIARVLRAVDNGSAAAETLERLKSIAAQGLRACTDDRTGDFLAAITAYHDGLAALAQVTDTQLVSPEHARLHELVTHLGGVYKFSGAGGGDLGIAFSTGSEVLQQIQMAAAQNGFMSIDLGQHCR